MLPGHTSPAASFDQPFEMLAACHERVQRSLGLLQRLAAHLAEHGNDSPARSAAADVLRYFDLAAPHHHEDEERHVFPALLRSPDAALRAAVEQLQRDHAEMRDLWSTLRVALQAVAAGESAAFDAPTLALLQRFVALHQDHLRIEDSLVYPQARAAVGPGSLQMMGDEMAQRRGATRPGSRLSGERG
ncbi:hemerythrin domain-containing protein [Caldimonas brevitalea]|nr:hemerythrin domain-containing protein [Caldimonas brevitalea]